MGYLFRVVTKRYVRWIAQTGVFLCRGVADGLRTVGKSLVMAAAVRHLVLKSLVKAIGAAFSLTNPLTFHF